MTEVEFLKRFQRQPNGVWAAQSQSSSTLPMVQLPLARRHAGALFTALDLAKQLDYSVSKEGMIDA
jgi:hypothetical protein